MSESSRRRFLSSTIAATATAALSNSLEAASGPRKIRVGQIGTKHAHAGGKMATFRKFPELFEVVGVVEPDPERRKAVKDTPTYRGVPFLAEAELLKTDSLKAVAVETDIPQLLPTAHRCIDAGVHIHLDKPAGVSLPEFRRICAAADRKKLVIQMGYMFRSNAAFRFLFNAVRKGWLGDVFQVHCEMSKKVGDGTRRELAQYKGGSMFELGCHLIDAVVTVLGKPDRVTPFLRNTRPDYDNLMDNCLAVFEYPKATASIRSSVSEVDGGRSRQFVACGTRGTIVIQPLEPHVLTLTLERDVEGYKRGTHTIELPPSTGRYDGDMTHLARAIQGLEEPEYGTTHDLAVQESVLRASGMPVT